MFWSVLDELLMNTINKNVLCIGYSGTLVFIFLIFPKTEEIIFIPAVVINNSEMGYHFL